MKKIVALILSISIAHYSNAQDCKPEVIAKLHGTWKKNQQGTTPNVNAADLIKEKSVLSNIHKLISTNYKPTGCQVAYSTVFGKDPADGKNWIGDPFHYKMYILRLFCDKNSADKSKYYTDVATSTTFQITANAIPDLTTLNGADLPDDHLRGYLKLKQKPQKKDGFYFLGEEIVGDSHLKNRIMQYTWLITYNDTLPFYYMSRKEYLQRTKKRLEKTMSEQSDSKAYYQKFMNRINDYLNKSADFLNMPAICMWNDEEQFNGFAEEGTKGSFFAVRPNMSYFRKNVKKPVPQFFTVQYKLTEGDPVFEENISGIKKALDFEKLRIMLGK
jgi:hypothetical protein